VTIPPRNSPGLGLGLGKDVESEQPPDDDGDGEGKSGFIGSRSLTLPLCPLPVGMGVSDSALPSSCIISSSRRPDAPPVAAATDAARLA